MRSKDPTGNCRSCGAMIVWFKTISGKNMPVNITEQALEDAKEGEFYNPKNDEHIAHFATCPNADKHRRRSY